MSETLSQDPDGLGVAYTNLSQTYPPTPATPSSTVQDGAPPGANLPPFSTFASDMDSNTGFGSVSDRLFSDTRLLDISNWDYYTETRLLERGENGLSIITSQPQYRPWESKPGADASTSTYPGTTPINTLADAFSQQNGASKLPSFQSQFQTFSDQATTTEPTTLTTLTNLTPVSPNSSSPQSLTTLNSNFHTLSAVNVNRSYPLVPAPIQAREIPSIQQQFLDERHIQLYSHPPANIALNNTLHPTFLNGQNGALIQNNQLISSPTVVTVLKSEPDIKLSSNLAALHQDSLKIQNVGLHPTQFQNPMTQLHNSDSGLYNGIEKKMNGNMTSPTRNDFRKKERRKMRASSLESSVDSDGASSNMDLGSENSGQVAAISSTAGFKTHQMQVNSSVDMDTDISGGSVDKQVKKKRKRCGECIGCQRKDNCGDCAPCRNDKSHQICKQRRCEKLTEKKNLYQDGFLRGESRRGRGKGRGGASYRGRKPSAGVSNPLSAGNLPPEAGATVVPSGAQPSSRPSPQPTQSVPQPMPVQQQPMTPMPFYADPNRFPTPVWQTDPTQGWPQGQFIQQIPTAGQPIEAYQQYPNGIYQTTYQQPAFETNTFYTGAVQVLTNPRPPSNPNQQVQQQQLAPPRPNSSNYSHTPSPSPAQTQQQQNAQTQAQGAANRQYQEYGQQQQNFIPPATTPTGTETSGNNSRPSSVNNMNPPTPNQNYQQSGQPQTPQTPQQQQQNFTTITNFSPNSQASYQNSGNGQPGYPQVNSSSPQLASHNSSGYPGQEQFGGQHEQQWHDEQVMWEQQQQHQQQQQIKIEQDYNNQSQSNAYMQQEVNNSPTKMDGMHSEVKTFSQADKVNLNTRIKTMILNKQQENKMEESKNVDQNTTGHFLWYSHHHHLKENIGVDGGSFKHKNDTDKQQQNLERHKTENYDLKQACDPVNYSSGCWKSSNNFRHEQIAQNYTKTNLQQSTAQRYPVDLQQTSSRHCQNVPNANYNQPRVSLHEPGHYNVSSHSSVFRQPQNVYFRRDSKNAQTSQERQSPMLLDYTSSSRHNGQTANYPHSPVNGIQISPQVQSANFKQGQLSYSSPQENARSTPLASNIIYPPNEADVSFAQSFHSDYPLQQEIKQERRCTSVSENYPSCDQTFNRKLTEEPAVPLPIKQEFPPGFEQNQQICENVNANTPPASNSPAVPNCSPHNLPPNYSLSAMDLSQYKSSNGNLQGVQRDQQPNKAAVINNSNSNLPHNENQYKSPKIMHSTPIQMKGTPFEEQEQDSSIFGEKPNMEIPNCKCFSPPKTSTEEGIYYTHLGCANSLKNLRYDFECRTGVVGNAIRIEKVRYTGKEGKTAQGCPIAKWIIRRQNNDEKYLVIVKHRRGHVCHSAFIVICIVAWEGVERGGADELYSLITEKLNKFGVPTKRRCATNEPRTCACQGVNPDTCGASFSFGCSWSMFFNGCKFARSKEARKFRLTEKKEEKQLEERMQKLANHLSPVYKCLAPKSFNNQIVNEEIASDCRLGDVPGRPFSGVTACMDFCAHAHKDTHNMINGCTVVVTLTKHRDLSKPSDEQLHVLPMYVADDTDEFGSREEQEKKVMNGGIEILEKYPREVRTCSVPATTCQKRGRKPKEDKQVKRKLSFLSSSSSSNSFSSSSNDKYMSSNEIQNGHVSSTVLDYPNKSTNWKYDNYQPGFNGHSLHHNPSHGNVLPQFSVFKTPLSPDCYYRNDYTTKYYNPSYHYYTPNLMSTPHLSSYAAQFSSYPSYQINNPFDDLYTNNTLHSLDYGPPQLPNPPGKFIDISYTDNIECFRDKDIGGVAIALSHGSVLFECAKHEIHATTAIKKPNRLSPTRISLVFYQHKSLNASQHGLNEYVKKMKRKSEEIGQDLEKSDGDSKIEYSSVLVEKKDVMLRAPTLPTVTVTTLFPMYPCIVTGPFQEQ